MTLIPTTSTGLDLTEHIELADSLGHSLEIALCVCQDADYQTMMIEEMVQDCGEDCAAAEEGYIYYCCDHDNLSKCVQGYLLSICGVDYYSVAKVAGELADAPEWEDLLAAGIATRQGVMTDTEAAAAPPEVQNRWAFNYLRHQLTSYDDNRQQKRYGPLQYDDDLGQAIDLVATCKYPQLKDEVKRRFWGGNFLYDPCADDDGDFADDEDDYYCG